MWISTALWKMPQSKWTAVTESVLLSTLSSMFSPNLPLISSVCVILGCWIQKLASCRILYQVAWKLQHPGNKHLLPWAFPASQPRCGFWGYRAGLDLRRRWGSQGGEQETRVQLGSSPSGLKPSDYGEILKEWMLIHSLIPQTFGKYLLQAST